MRSTVAHINLDALRWNLTMIRRKAGSAAVCAMVKANAYGHGLVPIARALVADGVDFLGVALVDEAVALREAGITIPILVLTPNEDHEAGLIVRHELTPVICSLEQARLLAHAASMEHMVLQGHLYVDTGMRRDGVPFHDAPEVLAQMDTLANLDIVGICTHFATSDVPHDEFLSEQLDRFNHLLSKFREHGRTFAHIHAANTGALWQADKSAFTLVRPGLSLYGYANPPDPEVHLRPVMSITSRVLSKRRVWPGETISYGRRYMTSAEATICTVPIGYGDGYLRILTNRAWCLIGGHRYPVVGTVCMDEIMVNVGDADVNVGDEVVLLGVQAAPDGRVQSIDATDIAMWAETIPYEITTAVSARIPRVYVQEGE